MNPSTNHQEACRDSGRPSRSGQLAAEMMRLTQASAHDLRIEWRRFYRADPPNRLSRDMLLRGVLYKVQEQAHGGLSRRAKRILHLLADKHAALGDDARDPSGLLKPGARVMREWRGRTFSVGVHEDGFDYDGRRYRSLTQIAEEITGAHWSGPRFFGLRDKGSGDAC
jgi:hypothetical protein